MLGRMKRLQPGHLAWLWLWVTHHLLLAFGHLCTRHRPHISFTAHLFHRTTSLGVRTHIGPRRLNHASPSPSSLPRQPRPTARHGSPTHKRAAIQCGQSRHPSFEHERPRTSMSRSVVRVLRVLRVHHADGSSPAPSPSPLGSSSTHPRYGRTTSSNRARGCR